MLDLLGLDPHHAVAEAIPARIGHPRAQGALGTDEVYHGALAVCHLTPIRVPLPHFAGAFSVVVVANPILAL